MPDNVDITPGSGEKVAARDVMYSGENAKAQAVGLVLLSGEDDLKQAKDVSAQDPFPVSVYGELLEALEALRITVGALSRTIGMALPNAQGFPIMEARQATAANLNAQITIAGGQTLGTITTLTTLTNQAQIGGFAAQDQIPAFMHLQADSLRRNIMVT